MSIEKIKTNSHEEWLALRHQYIGGSDAAAVVGLNAYASPYSLWAEKTGRVPGFSGNLATEVGAFLEEFVAQKFAEETGKKVRRANQSFINSDYPFAIANIDRKIVGEEAGLEIKTTNSLNLKKFKNGDYPSHYYCQCVHYMAVTGKQRWYLAVLIGNNEFRWFTIERDEDEIAALMEAERSFWEYVVTDKAPPADGSAATSDTLRAVFADSSGDTVDLTAYKSDLDEYISLGERIDELKTSREAAANRIKAFMEDAAGGACEGYKVSWKTSARSTLDAKALQSAHPELDLSAFHKTTSVRTFKVTKK